MTTIATDGKTMAGDGLVTSGCAIFGTNCVKVRKLADGRIVGMAGSAYDFDPFCEWLENGGDHPGDMIDDFEALVLNSDGTCLSYNNKGRCIPEELPTATGSGRDFALAAMDLGFSPEEAVKLACKRDTNSGGTIVVIERPTVLKRIA